MSEPVACPACGTPQTQTGWGEELCPGCLLRLALQPLTKSESDSIEAETDLHPDQNTGPLSPGKVLGNRYSVRKLLGKGGMGEVWRAFDLKLRVDVALKALRQDLFRDQRRLEMLRQEVRAAREVMSSNVCRIFDLVEAEGHELVSMEYVDGETLLHVLQQRGPLDLEEARELASQFLAGLEAIHKVGLVHRDVKPENIMLTRAGRVVVMDFGLARQEESGAGTVAGTPAYMAPEQAAGLQVDARADVYSAGVVLAEMVSPEGIKNLESRQNVWESVRSEPAKLPDTPWAPVIEKAVAKDREERFNSAHTLIRALEDRAIGSGAAEGKNPYPGLSSFTEEDAEYFFGREAEVERLWRRLDRPHLLGVVGPSGSGKSSFINAGLIPSAGDDWAIVRCTPGDAALASLRRALVSEISNDSVAVGQLAAAQSGATVAAYTRWRERHGYALLIVDQFEELFTLNTAGERAEAAELLSRLALDADVFVLLSMRDDFLMGCRDYRPLTPIFEDLTALPTLSGGALRRAVVQPAAKCGFRFEDDHLVEEMLAEVDGERGALPLLAFAMARLWEKRDRENGVLTRQAYHDIGGVGGALARHAEETMDRIGSARVPVVRELFRNLVTAEGTRAVREWDELLSVFGGKAVPGDQPPDRRGSGIDAGRGFTPRQSDAEEALRALIDARLLTSYEIQEDDGESTRRVEIIHESLLANWPRLVRWQTQDVEGAQVRDELRQAARAWDEHGRHDDRLWTGSAFKEYEVWRDRYPGGLTELEQAYADAMVSLATRRLRRRRIAGVTGVSVLLVVLAVVTGLWRQSVRETRRAEAQKLIALGQIGIDNFPTTSLAWALASLELTDSREARLLALRALSKGPTVSRLSDANTSAVAFTPDGHWLVQGAWGSGRLRLFHEDGSSSELDSPHTGAKLAVVLAPEDPVFITRERRMETPSHFVLWSAPEARMLAEARYGSPVEVINIGIDAPRRRAVLFVIENGRAVVDGLGYDGDFHRLGTIDLGVPENYDWHQRTALDRSGKRVTAVVNGDVWAIEVEADRLASPLRIGQHADARSGVGTFDRPLVTFDDTGEIRLWDGSDATEPIVIRCPPDGGRPVMVTISSDGSHLHAVTMTDPMSLQSMWVWRIGGSSPQLVRRFNLDTDTRAGVITGSPSGRLVANSTADMTTRLHSLSVPADAEPAVLLAGVGTPNSLSIHPGDGWVALGAASGNGLNIWPIPERLSVVIRRHQGPVTGLAFDPDGRWLVSGSVDRSAWMWPLEVEAPAPGRELELAVGSHVIGVAASPDGLHVLAGTGAGAQLLSINGDKPSVLSGVRFEIQGVAFSLDGRYAATIGRPADSTEQRLVVWDALSGERVADLRPPERLVPRLQFLEDGGVLAVGETALWRWDGLSGECRKVYEGHPYLFSASADGRRAMVLDSDDRNETGNAVLVNLESGDIMSTFVRDMHAVVALDPTGTIAVAGGSDGVVRIGSAAGGEPHLMFGHEQDVIEVAIDPLGRWIASAGADGTVRLWPMPDLSKPPLHTLPREELIAKLKTLTNIRVVRDDESATGWKLTHDPSPGWETVPTW